MTSLEERGRPGKKPGQVHLMRQTGRCGMRAICETTVCDIFCLGCERFEAPMVTLLIKSELSLNGSDAKRHASGVPVTDARVLRSGHHNAVRKPMLSGRDRVSCAEPWERSADTVLQVSRLRSVREGREGSVVDRPDANTRALSDALRSVGRTYVPAPWTRSHTPLTWTTAEEEFIAGTRYFK